MKNQRYLLFALTIIIIGVFLNTMNDLEKERGEIPDSEDSQQIQEAIRLSYEIGAQAIRTYDVSAFSTVFINDSRGPKFGDTVVDLIRSVRNNPNLTADSVGYLDYKLAYYAWRAKGAQIYEEVWGQARREGRNTLTEEENQRLVDTSGKYMRMYSSGIPTTFPVIETTITFFSISIHDDLAKVIFSDNGHKIEMIMVKKDGRWYLAGGKILESYI